MRTRTFRPSGVLHAIALVAAFGSRAAAQTAPPTTPLRQFDAAIQALVDKVSPSVVQIVVAGFGQVDEGDNHAAGLVIGPQRAIGAGFVIDSSGYIVTNAHVVQGAQQIQIVVPDHGASNTPLQSLSAHGALVAAHVVGVASDVDLALLKVDGLTLPALPVARYSDLKQGELVFAFGSPGGLRNSVSMGVISATARQVSSDSPMVYIQTDAAINPGNSGGPLVNVNGEVVGVDTFILSQSGGNEGLGFAIPSSLVRVSYDQLREYGHVHRGTIGASAQTVTPELAEALHLARATGLIVSDVAPGGPADQAGLRVGDLVVNVDGQAMDNVPFLAFHVMAQDAGTIIHFDVLRGSDRVALAIPVTVLPHRIDQLAALADPDKSLVLPLGILGVAITAEMAQQMGDVRGPGGVLVVARAAGTAVNVALESGDVILALNGRTVGGIDDLRATLAGLPADAAVALQIQRNDGLLYVAFRLPKS
jgi:serine protease Do